MVTLGIPGTELKLALLTLGINVMAKNVVMWACGTVTICGTAILLFLDTCGTAILFFLHVWYRHPVFLQIIRNRMAVPHLSKNCITLFPGVNNASFNSVPGMCTTR